MVIADIFYVFHINQIYLGNHAYVLFNMVTRSFFPEELLAGLVQEQC